MSGLERLHRAQSHQICRTESGPLVTAIEPLQRAQTPVVISYLGSARGPNGGKSTIVQVKPMPRKPESVPEGRGGQSGLLLSRQRAVSWIRPLKKGAVTVSVIMWSNFIVSVRR